MDSQAVGVATSDTLFQSELQKRLLAVPALADQAVQYSHDAIRLAAMIKTMPEGELRVGLTQAYADGLRKVWLGMCVMAVVGAYTCVFAKEYTLNGRHNAEQVLQRRNRTGKNKVSEDRGGLEQV